MATETIESLCQTARQSISQGKVDHARQLYHHALELNPKSADVHYGLATTYYLLNELEYAAHYFREVTRLDPLRAAAYINLGAVLNRIEDYEGAIKALRNGIQIDPDRAEGHYNLGLVYRNMGDAEQAVQCYLDATRLNPKMIDAHLNLANAYFQMERYDVATSQYRLVLQLKPNWDKAQKGLAAAEAALKDKGQSAPQEEEDSEEADAIAEAIESGQVHDLCQAAMELQNRGSLLLQTIEKEIKPVLQELSFHLNGPRAASFNLGPHVQKYEAAFQSVRSVFRDLQNSVVRVRNVGKRLLAAQDEEIPE